MTSSWSTSTGDGRRFAGIGLPDVMAMMSADSRQSMNHTRAWMSGAYQRDLRSTESIRRAWYEWGGPENYIAHLRTVLAQRGWTMPPVDIWLAPEGAVLIDGHHRVFAAADLGVDVIPARIEDGPRWSGMTYGELLYDAAR